jgi:hypothetical protein
VQPACDSGAEARHRSAQSPSPAGGSGKLTDPATMHIRPKRRLNGSGAHRQDHRAIGVPFAAATGGQQWATRARSDLMALSEIRGSGTDSVVWRSGRREDASAERVEVGSAVHLAFDRFDAVDVAFDGSGAVGQAESGGDGG